VCISSLFFAFRCVWLSSLILSLPTTPTTHRDRYNKARAIFDFLFGVRFHKTFARVIRDKSQTCGSGLFPSTQGSSVPAALTSVWGSGADVNVIMADKCDLKCQDNPQQEFKKDSYSKDKKQKPTVPQDKFITVPLKGVFASMHMCGVCN
jgi:hypothetical protein